MQTPLNRVEELIKVAEKEVAGAEPVALVMNESTARQVWGDAMEESFRGYAIEIRQNCPDDMVYLMRRNELVTGGAAAA